MNRQPANHTWARSLALVVSLAVVCGLIGASVVAVRHAIADETIASVDARLVELQRTQAKVGIAADEATIKQLAADTTSHLA